MSIRSETKERIRQLQTQIEDLRDEQNDPDLPKDEYDYKNYEIYLLEEQIGVLEKELKGLTLPFWILVPKDEKEARWQDSVARTLKQLPTIAKEFLIAEYFLGDALAFEIQEQSDAWIDEEINELLEERFDGNSPYGSFGYGNDE